ncbi:hypothetical protein [Rhizobium leguminosarum]|uniref:hypothetical protein n=1 Tax=Rhizobium leguminosarum TaxID=384 RepID=UPI001FE22C6F|nr:hypothetical protein [Rhizobium leguminosarum]
MELDIAPTLPDLQFVAAWLGTPDRRTLEDVVAIASQVVQQAELSPVVKLPATEAEDSAT